VHVADALLNLVPTGALRGKGENALFRSTIESISARIAMLRDDAEIWDELPLRHLPNLKTKAGRNRREGIEYKAEIIALAAEGQGLDARRLSTAVALFQRRAPRSAAPTPAPEPEYEDIDVDNEDVEEGEKPGPTRKTRRKKTIETDFEWPVMHSYAATTKRFLGRVRGALALSFDGTNVGYLGEVMQLLVLHLVTGTAAWLPPQVAALYIRACMHACVYYIYIVESSIVESSRE